MATTPLFPQPDLTSFIPKYRYLHFNSSFPPVSWIAYHFSQLPTYTSPPPPPPPLTTLSECLCSANKRFFVRHIKSAMRIVNLTLAERKKVYGINEALRRLIKVELHIFLITLSVQDQLNYNDMCSIFCIHSSKVIPNNSAFNSKWSRIIFVHLKNTRGKIFSALSPLG